MSTTQDNLIGYIAMVISCIAFGNMFVPLKKVNSKDGIFVQWVECGVVFIVGCVINCIRGFPEFQWIAAVGGALYATGNVFSVPIVGGIGMGLGLLIWGTMQIVVGWSVARFGLFGWLKPTNVVYDWMNYVGLGLTILSGILFVFVRHDNSTSAKGDDDVTSYDVQKEATETERESAGLSDQSEQPSERQDTMKGVFVKKVPFILMAMVLAVFHGLMMCPIDILKQKYPSDDKFKVFDYCFSFYTSVFFFSTIYFFLYNILWCRKAYVERELVIPSIIYGCLWTTGMTLWFLSSDRLSQVVAYPITTRLPAMISAVLEVLIYKSIRGQNNILYLSFTILIGLSGVVLIALSNQNL